MKEIVNPIAEIGSPDSGDIVEPSQSLYLEKKQKFFCPDHDCKDPNRILILAKSKLNNYFFKHKPNFHHEIHPETLLHKSAIKWFKERKNFQIPRYKEARGTKDLELDSTKTLLEFRKLKQLIPDVQLTTRDGFIFAVEIVVTSDIKPEKAKLIEQFELPTLRIDLSKFYAAHKEECRTDYTFIQQHLDDLLMDINLKDWVIAPTDTSEEKFKTEDKPSETSSPTSEIKQNDNTGMWVVLGILGAALLIKFYSPKKHSKNKYMRNM